MGKSLGRGTEEPRQITRGEGGREGGHSSEGEGRERSQDLEGTLGFILRDTV